jgi:hypothetical protein
MHEESVGGVTVNHRDNGRFAPGNKAAVGTIRKKGRASIAKAIGTTLNEQFPPERIAKIYEDAVAYAYRFAEEYHSPKMLIAVASRLSDETGGKPVQRIAHSTASTPDEWLAALRGEPDEPNDNP